MRRGMVVTRSTRREDFVALRLYNCDIHEQILCNVITSAGCG